MSGWYCALAKYLTSSVIQIAPLSFFIEMGLRSVVLKRLQANGFAILRN
jgi:hypothetical protein